MIEIELTKAALVPPARVLRPSGTVVTVDADVAEGLVARGVAERVDAPDDVLPQESSEDDGGDETGQVTDPVDDAVPAPEESSPAPTRTRPKKTAPLSAWQEYAHKAGMKTTGMKREEIIGAVEAQNL